MRMHITETMVDASFAAMKAEAIKDGHDWEAIESAEPDQVKRFREVVRAMLQAAADVATQKST
jgi:hypothetical protein